MFKKKLLAGILSAAMVFTMLPVGNVSVAKAETAGEVTLEKNAKADVNPIGGMYDGNGNLVYTGDPAVLVDGDTVYLYGGHDVSKNESYSITEWVCYSTKDLHNWNYEGVVMEENPTTISWASSKTAAWAGQVAKHKDPSDGKDKYYFYWCTYEKANKNGAHSIGVSVSESPTGPFVDIGHPLVYATQTPNGPHEQGADWSDIDPTVWVETGADGEEHRYLAWGNDVLYTCELNEDMISVKDVNGDGEITYGIQKNGATSASADIISMNIDGALNSDAGVSGRNGDDGYTEAPWLYRRQDENGNYYGDYYLFYAYGWREQMAYAMMPSVDGLMDGTWVDKGVIMEPTATSDTNHMSVFDFKGKTYFVYHNGSLPGGSGYRRTPCIAEVHFNEDGTIQYIPETAAGINGKTSVIYTSSGDVLAHESYHNSSNGGMYPYVNVKVAAGTDKESADAQWVLVDGKANKERDSFVSIQSENKPGLYLTANDDQSVTLAHDWNINATSATAKKQTFKTVSGLAGSGVSFESVSQPGYYITLIGSNSLSLTDGSNAKAATFYVDEEPEVKPDGEASSANWLEYFAVAGYEVTEYAGENRYSVIVPSGTSSLDAQIVLFDTNGYYVIDGVAGSGSDKPISISPSANSSVEMKVYAADGTLCETYTLDVYIDAEPKQEELEEADMSGAIVKTFGFDDTTDGAVAVSKAVVPPEVADPSYTYSDGVNGKALNLPGSWGLKLGDAPALFGDSYTLSFWINPSTVLGENDPLFCAGSFSDGAENWISLAQKNGFWSKDVEVGGSFRWSRVSSTTTISKNKWQNVVFSMNKGTATLYIDGVQAAKGDASTMATSEDGTVAYFGINRWDGIYTGAVDELVILNRPVTANEAAVIAKNYANIGNNMKYAKVAVINKAGLEQVIASVSGLDASKYDADSFAALQNAVEEGQAVLDNASATQEQVDEATVAIKDARSKLSSSEAVDTTALDAAIADAETMDGEAYTAASYKALTKAVAKAKAVKARATATQAEVDAAAAAINSAKAGLTLRTAAEEIVHYDMTAEGTTLKDVSGNGYDATLSGVSAQAGKDGSLYLANNGFIQLPKDIFVGKDTLTISIWAKDLNGKANTSLMYFGTEAASSGYPASYWILNPCNTDGKLKSVLTESENPSAPYNTEIGVSPTTASRGVAGPENIGYGWNHYVTVISPTKMTVYLNGNNVASTSIDKDITEFGQDLVAYIGKSSYSDPTFNGFVREVSVYEGAMSDNEVAMLHEATKVKPTVDVTNGDDLAGYLYVCFADASGGGSDVQQVHFFLSLDGLNWTAVNGCLPAYTVGKDYPTSNYAFTKDWKLQPLAEAQYYDDAPGATSNGAVYDAAAIAETASGDASVLFPFEGRDHGIRDPYLIRGSLADGSDANKVRILATDLNIYDKQYGNQNWGRMTSSKENGDTYDSSTSGGSKQLFIWETSDFVNWERTTVDVATEINGGCAWAPEAVYNPAKDNYLVYWSCRVDTDGYARNRLYCNETKDFKTFGPTKMYEEEAFYQNYGKVVNANDGYGNIDTSQLWVANGDNPYGTLYRLVKDETNNHIELMSAATVLDPNKDYDVADPNKIHAYEKNGTSYAAKADLAGLNDYEKAEVVYNWFIDESVGNHFTKISQTGIERYSGAFEGATMFKFIDRDEWCVMIDNYGSHSIRYEPYTTTDLSNADSITKAAAKTYGRTGGDVGCHGGIIPITAKEYNQIIETYNNPARYAEITGIPAGQIRTKKNGAGYLFHDIDTIDYEGSSKLTEADKTQLQAAIAAAKAIDAEEYTEESVAALQAAIANAEKINANKMVSQQLVDATTKAVTTAQAALVKKQSDEPVVTPVDKTALAAAITAAEAVTKADFTEESFAAFEAALTNAKSVNGSDAATQEQVDAAKSALTAAQAALVRKQTDNGGNSGGNGSGSGSSSTAATSSATTTTGKTDTTKAGVPEGMTVSAKVTETKNEDGSVTKTVEIPKLAKQTSATVAVQTDADGVVASVKANVEEGVIEGSTQAVITDDMIDNLVAAAGGRDVDVSMVVRDASGDVQYRLNVNTADLNPGAKLRLYKKIGGELVMVNAKEYKVTQSGGLSLSIKSKGEFQLLSEDDAAVVDKQIESTVKLARKSVSLKKKKTAKIPFAKALNMANVKSISYASKKKSVVSVSKSGMLTAKKVGTTVIKIKVTLKNGTKKTLSYKVTVK